MPTLIEINSTPTIDAQVKIEKEVKGKFVRRRRSKPTETVGKQLLRKISKAVSNYYNVVGAHIAVVVQTKTRTNRSRLRIFGSKSLVQVIRREDEKMAAQLDNSITVVDPDTPNEKNLFYLPPLAVGGVAQPLSTMTQSNLRAFIPFMLKYSTGRGKPGWGKEYLRPVWWPQDLPWMSVRMDCRSEDAKHRVSWTVALRQIIKNCYHYHGREDLLQESDALHKRIHDFNPDFITYQQSLKCLLRSSDINEDVLLSDENESEEENKNIETANVHDGSDGIVIRSSQPYLIYTVPQNTPPIYTIPVQPGAVNVVNVFTKDALKSLANNLAHHFAGKTILDAPQISIREGTNDVVMEEEKQSNIVLEIPKVRSSYGALEIDGAILLNDQQPTVDQFAEYNLRNAIEEAEYIYLDNIPAKTENFVEEKPKRKVIIVDPVSGEVNIQ